MALSLTIIIPVYNEVATVGKVIAQVKKRRIPGVKREVIVVDDGSTDGSRQKVQKINGITLLIQKKNQGKGAAIRRALQVAQGDYILIQDADLEYDPHDYQKLLEPVLKKRAEVVYGSRFLGPHKNMLFWHFLANQCVSFLTNILYNSTLSDIEVGYKVFPRKLGLSLNLQARGFDFEPEITAKILKRGIRIFEVPISYYGREYSDGKKITSKDAMIALFTLLKYRFIS
ncbi:MAG: dolichyl-phosphate mannose synthase related protein [uncultured bacterium]|nr:MAG: dolichyl-phosphate mannose synthase related protein [uncultured bacterium]